MELASKIILAFLKSKECLIFLKVFLIFLYGLVVIFFLIYFYLFYFISLFLYFLSLYFSSFFLLTLAPRWRQYCCNIHFVLFCDWSFLLVFLLGVCSSLFCFLSVLLLLPKQQHAPNLRKEDSFFRNASLLLFLMVYLRSVFQFL